MSLVAFHPMRWPHGWFLPLVRNGSGNPLEVENQGVIIQDQGVILPVVFIVNAWDLNCPDDLIPCKREEYSCLQHLLSDWRVD